MNRGKIFLNAEYSALQILYWSMYCAIPGFLGVYLLSRGYTNTVIGNIIAVGGLASMILSSLLASYADRHGMRSNFRINLILTALELVLILPALFFSGKTAALPLSLCAFLGVLISVNPVNTALCLAVSSGGVPVNYGAGRGLGSCAYGAANIILGIAVAESSPNIVPFVCAGLVILQGIALLLFRRHAARFASLPALTESKEEQSSSILGFFTSNPRYSVFLLGVAFLFFAHDLINNFLINIVQALGGGTKQMGIINGIRSCSELPAMFLFDRIARKIDCRKMIRFGAVFFLMRVAATAFSSSIPMLMVSQVFQGLGFAVITPGLVRYAAISVPEKDASKAQSITFAMITLGSVFSGFAGGILLDAFSVRTVLFIAAAVAVLGLLIFQLSISPAPKE